MNVEYSIELSEDVSLALMGADPEMRGDVFELLNDLADDANQFDLQPPRLVCPATSELVMRVAVDVRTRTLTVMEYCQVH